jgi:hypothetical protein
LIFTDIICREMGVPIGADWDPAKPSFPSSMPSTYAESAWGPGSMLIHIGRAYITPRPADTPDSHPGALTGLAEAGAPAERASHQPSSEARTSLTLFSIADARLPVYVFIHGGSFIEGASNQIDMTEIVEKAGVVGVSFQLPARHRPTGSR